MAVHLLIAGGARHEFGLLRTGRSAPPPLLSLAVLLLYCLFSLSLVRRVAVVARSGPVFSLSAVRGSGGFGAGNCRACAWW